MQNSQPLKRTKLKVKCTSDLRKSPGRLDLQRGILRVSEQGENIVASTGAQGSGILSSLAQANCFIVLPSEKGSVSAGEIVEVQLFDEFIC